MDAEEDEKITKRDLLKHLQQLNELIATQNEQFKEEITKLTNTFEPGPTNHHTGPHRTTQDHTGPHRTTKDHFLISFLHESSGKKKMKTISKKFSKKKTSKLFKIFSKKLPRVPMWSWVVLGGPGWSWVVLSDPMVILW